jgi:hypothetical protein
MIDNLIRLQKQSADILAARIRKLENQEPATRIYAQPNDPAASEEVGESALWIDTDTYMIYYRTGLATWVTLTVNSYVAGAPVATGYVPITINGVTYKLLTST